MNGFAKRTTIIAILIMSSLVSVANEAKTWPREVTINGNSMVFYQPQMTSWSEFYTELAAKQAVSVTTDGQTHYGVLNIEAGTETDMESREVSIYDIRIIDVTFPSLEPENAAKMADLARSMIPGDTIIMSLDRMVADLDRREAVKDLELSFQPPVILVSTEPAVLVNLDGEVIFSPVEGTDLMSAVNTNWDLFLHAEQGNYYLRHESQWLVSKAVQGPWRGITSLPKGFQTLPDNENWAETLANLNPAGGAHPRILVSNEPAELILMDGKPALSPIDNTRLLYVTNTESDLFLNLDDQQYYYLVAGRWFKTADLESGNWQSAAGSLPEGFARIPEDHARGAVLVSVPGTPQAEEAVIMSQIPTMAQVQREKATVEPGYAGEPEFVAVKGTPTVYYAANTSYDVLRVGSRYYLCYQGVWFVSSFPGKGFIVCDDVPLVIYSIPPKSHLHYVTYVRVYSITPTHVVFGYTNGYMGVYVSRGVVVWGTGWRYRPWVRAHIYFRRPHCYGFAAWYNPRIGTFGRRARICGPYGGAGRGAVYNPRTGTYGRGQAAWGPRGSAARAYAYNPRTGNGAATRQFKTPYASWGESVVKRGDKITHTAHHSNARGSRKAFENSDGGKGIRVENKRHNTTIVKDKDNNVYVGRDGKVYKKTGEGWSRNQGGTWKPSTRKKGAGATVERQLNRDSKQRTRGQQRQSRNKSSSVKKRNNQS